MNLYEAQHLARDLMNRHGLPDWHFKFDHARRRFGSCRIRSRTITLSRPLTLLNPIDEVRDTILHEIAHALTPGDGHGSKWKTACRAIGAVPKRCFDETSVVAPPRKAAPLLIGCARCNWWADRRRRTRSKLICKLCRGPVTYRAKAATSSHGTTTVSGTRNTSV
jgi:predicted SprT family Zn-dependent metalloprotease